MLKRLFDIVISASLLIVLTPVLAAVALLVRKKLGSPVLFRQLRPGHSGQLFTLNKFRSMTSECNESGELLPDAVRLTAFGQFLRRTSLDELPTLYNVLIGEMSIVGPRPLLTSYLPLYSTHEARRHEVKPGVTGWAQVNGRNAISWPEKFERDVWYVDNHTFLLDIKILCLTLGKVFAQKDISADGYATMEQFSGSADK